MRSPTCPPGLIASATAWTLHPGHGEPDGRLATESQASVRRWLGALGQELREQVAAGGVRHSTWRAPRPAPAAAAAKSAMETGSPRSVISARYDGLLGWPSGVKIVSRSALARRHRRQPGWRPGWTWPLRWELEEHPASPPRLTARRSPAATWSHLRQVLWIAAMSQVCPTALRRWRPWRRLQPGRGALGRSEVAKIDRHAVGGQGQRLRGGHRRHGTPGG